MPSLTDPVWWPTAHDISTAQVTSLSSRGFRRPTFPATGMAKDMRCALEAARSVDAITPLHSVAESLLKLYCEHFDTTLDWTAVSTMFGSRRYFLNLQGAGVPSTEIS